jgi:1A family penicillin-binding protein
VPVAAGLLSFLGMEERGFQERLQAAWSRVRAAAGEAWRRVHGGLAALWRPFAERRAPRLALGVVLAVGFALALAGGVAWQTCGFQGCPDAARLAAYRPGGAPLLLDRQGQVIATLSPDDLPEVRLRSLPEYLVAAFLAIEDRRFLEHGAVDWRRVAGAFAANLRHGGVEQGFSTITMQLARNLFPLEIPGQERTASRKLLEIRVAQQLEARFSKPEILELYLNHIYFGNGARGVEAAAWQYFRQPAARLTLAQAALLAALPKAPTRYDPRRHPDHALARRNLVLARMTAQARVAPELAAAAAREPLGVRSPPERPRAKPMFARYFAEEVRRQLEERFGESLYATPLRIWTTLDLEAQRAAEEELERQLRAIESGRLGRVSKAKSGAGRGAHGGHDETDGSDGSEVSEAGEASKSTRELQGAVVALEAASGDVLAWVGGRDYAASQFDRVSRARRQAGSAWKPFVYAAALARGIALSQPIADTPLVVPLAGGGTWEPRNYDGTFAGRVTLREALAQSRNVPTVRLAEAVGYDRIAALAASDGITSEVPLLPSMPLGTVAVSPLELTAAYTAFASLGWQVAPRVVLRVERADGTALWSAPAPSRRQVLDPAVAYLLDDALREALASGSGAPGLPPGFAGRAAGKTGTSTNGKDVWFIGFTPAVVAGVWIGYDEPRPIANQATGGRLAAPVFRRLMARIYAGRAAPQWWPMPPGVAAWPVDPASGLVLSQGCAPLDGAPAPRELFLAGHEPMSTCPGVTTAASNLLEGTTEGVPAAASGEESQIEIGPARAAGSAGEAGAGEAGGGETGGGGGGAGAAEEGQAGERAATVPPGPDAAGRRAAPTAPTVPTVPPVPPVPPAPASEASSPDEAAAQQPPGREAPPPAGSRGAAGATAANLGGWWQVTNAGDATGAEARGARTYRIALRQEGARVSGEGEEWEEDGRRLAAGARTRIELSGSIAGREVRLRYTERGPGGTASGTIVWRLAGGGDELSGAFSIAGADARGASSAVRLR